MKIYGFMIISILWILKDLLSIIVAKYLKIEVKDKLDLSLNPLQKDQN